MEKHARLRMVLNLCLMMGVGSFGCGTATAPAPSALPGTLVEQTATVPGGGGGANVAFHGESGWRIRITLTATTKNMTPYGFLESQAGSGQYQPPQETENHGQNSVELTLAQTGDYTLTVFDGMNQGGTVAVKVERLS